MTVKKSNPARTTRTLNPLPFGDLEPHRFEDLVRQLAYELRPWAALEAIGRGGADEGVDIVGREGTDESSSEDDGEGGLPPNVEAERVWFFQCKREKAFSPQQVRRAVNDALEKAEKTPHGFVLAVACDVSKKARDVFRLEMVERGVQEFQLWARGELEDLLFQSRNDRLLFAYFGISLQPRGRTHSSVVRGRVALKKQLKALFEKEGEPRHDEFLVLRNAAAKYPPPKGGRWPTVVAFRHLKDPGSFAVEQKRFMAWVDAPHDRWDFIESVDVLARRSAMELQAKQAWPLDDEDDGPPRRRGIEDEFWSEYVPEDQRAWLSLIRFVPFDRVVGIDPIDDGYLPMPHVFVEYDSEHGPFAPGFVTRFLPYGNRFAGLSVRPAERLRAKLFPVPLPSALYPPPAGIEFIPSQKTPLSAEANARLSALFPSSDLGAHRAAGSPPKLEDPAQDPYEARARAEKRAFRTWCDEIAVPLFSAVAEQLKASGHVAWVELRIPAMPISHSG